MNEPPFGHRGSCNIQMSESTFAFLLVGDIFNWNLPKNYLDWSDSWTKFTTKIRGHKLKNASKTYFIINWRLTTSAYRPENIWLLTSHFGSGLLGWVLTQRCTDYPAVSHRSAQLQVDWDETHHKKNSAKSQSGVKMQCFSKQTNKPQA